MRTALIFGLLLMGIGNAFAWDGPSPNVDVVVDGSRIPKYPHQGTTYVEALKGKKYSIRITNPLGERVAVALSVDGLNSIDAKHTEARQASKWILEPYETVVITGWQVNDRQARQFYFTTEEKSYGAKLGKTENLGLISAVFFKERHPQVYRRINPQPPYPPPYPPQPPYPPYPVPYPRGGIGMGSGGGMGGMGGGALGVPAPAEEAKSSKAQIESSDASRAAQPEYAATGMGNKVNHEVERIYLDLEDTPFATIDMRYEFRPILVKLGVFPLPPSRDPLARREKARGFSDGEYCPEP
jgi:hypothetical protein